MPFTASPLVEIDAETNFRQNWLSLGLVAERLLPPPSSGFISFTQALLLCLFVRFHSTPSTLWQWLQAATCMSMLTCTCITRAVSSFMEHGVLHNFCMTIYCVEFAPRKQALVLKGVALLLRSDLCIVFPVHFLSKLCYLHHSCLSWGRK